MTDSRSKNVIRNFKSGLLNRAVQIIFPFVIRSLIIQILGADYLGLDSLFVSILQVLNLAELGFSSAITYSMYKPIVDGDEKTICALLNLYKKIYRIIGIVILIIGILVTPFLGFLINGDIPDTNIYILYGLYLLNTVVSYMFFAYRASILNAHQRNDIVTNIQLVANLLQYALQIMALVVFKNYYMFVFVMCIATVVNNILILIMTKRKYPQYIPDGRVTDSQKIVIRKKIFGLMIYKICSTTRNSLDSVFISSMVGLTAVAIYSNYYAIMIAITNIMGVLTTSAVASVGNSLVVESEKKNYRDMRKIDFVYMWVSGWFTVCLACLYQPLMELWMGEENTFSYDIVILFCIYFYALKMGDVKALYSDAKGLWHENRYRTIMESISNIILNAVLGYFFGVPGIIMATLFSLLVFGFGYGAHILFKCYFVHEKISGYFLRHIVYAIITVMIGIITYFACAVVNLDNAILTFIAKMAICISLPNLIYLLVYRNTRIYKMTTKFVKDYIKTFVRFGRRR